MEDPEMNDRVEPSVFGEEDDDPFALPPPLDPLPPPGEDTGDIQAENRVLNLDGEAGPADQEAKKKKDRKPRVKLDGPRLCSPKGISALNNLCANIELKGKGHEESDLNKLLQQFEHWAQCLMPSWPFKNVVYKCEKLGPKRSVQNELKRVRRGDEDDILRGESEDEQAAGEGTGQTVIPGEQPELTPEVEQPEERPAPLTEVQPEERPAPLTEEQLERIQKNRELAFARWEATQKRKLLAESQQESTAEQSETAKEHPTLNDTGDKNSREQSATDRATVMNTTDTEMDIPIEETNQYNLSDNEDVTVVLTDHNMHNNVPTPSSEEPTENDGVHYGDNSESTSMGGITNSAYTNEEVSKMQTDIPRMVNSENADGLGEMADTNVNKIELAREENGVSHKTDLETEHTEGTLETNTENVDSKIDEDAEDMVIDATDEINSCTTDENNDNLPQKEKIEILQNGANVDEISDSILDNGGEMDAEFTTES